MTHALLAPFLRMAMIGGMTQRNAGVSQVRDVAFELFVIIPTLVLGGILVARDLGRSDWELLGRSDWELLLWALGIALVELLPLPAWRGLTISVGFPLLMVVAFLYPPGAAGAVAFLGASDPREFRRE